MNRRTLPIIFVAVALALALFADRGTAAEGAARETPTPTPSPSPTAIPPPTWSPDSPVPPDGVRVDCSGMRWNDKSNNEDGFFIDLIVCGGTPFEQRLQYEVPANTTEFLFPQEYFEAGKACPNSFAEEWGVGAFNSYGRTGGSRGHGPIIKCAELPTATPTPVVVLPSAGKGALGGQDGGGWRQAALLAGGVVSLGAGGALVVQARGRTRTN